MVKPEIKGLKQYEQVHKLPAEVTETRRSSKYDQVLSDAKKSAIKLVLEDDDSSTNVYVALRRRITRDDENLQVRKRGLNVYVFAGMKPARISYAKASRRMKPAKIRS